MDPTVEVNEWVDIVPVFRHPGSKEPICMPSKMIWRNREILLTELALRFPTVAGKRMIHVFHVTDGANGYRLEFDAEALTWKLVALMPELPYEELPSQ